MTATAPPRSLPRPRQGRAPAPGRAMLALAGAEGRHLLRHPLTLAGAACSAWLLWLSQQLSVPVMHVVDGRAPIMLTPLYMGVLLAAALGAGRARRHRVDELYGATPTVPWRRVAAHLLAAAIVAALALGLVAGQQLWLASLDGAVGRPNPLELLNAPIIATLAVAVGTAVAVWLPPRIAVVAAPLLLLAAAGAWATGFSAGRGGSQAIWLLPLVDPGDEVPAFMLLRPAGWHALYLTGLVLICGGAALARRGPLASAPLLAVGLVAAVAAGVAQTRPPAPARVAEIAAALERPESVHACQRRGTVTYCALPGFEPWADLWQPVMDQLLAGLPPGTGRRDLTVRQGSVGWHAGPRELLERSWEAEVRPEPPGVVHTVTTWGRLERAGESQLVLAAAAATHAMELRLILIAHGPDGEVSRPGPVTGQAAEPGAPAAPATGAGSPQEGWEEPAYCQAPTVVALWLAAQGSADRAEALRRAVRDNGVRVVGDDEHPGFSGGRLLYLDPYSRAAWSHRSAAYAVQLLDRPAEQVRAALWRHWPALTRQGATRGELVRALGLAPLPSLRRQLEDLGLDAAAAAAMGTGADAADDAKAAC